MSVSSHPTAASPLAAIGPLPQADTNRKLKQYVDQLLSQKDRLKGEQEHYAAILAAAVADGFDKKALQELIKRLCADEKTVRKQDELLELYEAEYRRSAA